MAGDDMKIWHPRGNGVGGTGQHIHLDSPAPNAKVEIKPSKADGERFLDLLDRTLAPEKKRGGVGFSDPGKKDSLLDKDAKIETPDQFRALIDRALDREKTYLISAKPGELDAAGRALHGARLSDFMREARAKAEQLFGGDPAKHGEALWTLSARGAELMVQLFSSSRDKLKGSLDLLSATQRQAWAAPFGDHGMKLEMVGMRQSGLDMATIGFEIRTLGFGRNSAAFDDLETLLRLMGQNKVGT